MTDRDAVYALSRSLLDWIPGVPTTTGRIGAQAGQRGEAATEPAECPACHGRGRRRVRGVTQRCDRCAGSGERIVDAYTLREIAQAEDLDDPAQLLESICREFALLASDASTRGLLRLERRERMDAELRRLQTLVAVRAGEEAAEWWFSHALHAQEGQWARGGYRELTQALEILHNAAPFAHSIWHRFVVYAQPVILSDHTRDRLDAIADLLTNWMPTRPIRVPAELRPEARAHAAKSSLWRGRTAEHVARRRDRDALIRAMAADGLSAAQIAEHALVAVSVKRVRQILEQPSGPVASGPAA